MTNFATSGPFSSLAGYELKPIRFAHDFSVNNATVIPEADFHICRLPVEDRTSICKGALKEDFCQYNRIQYREDVPWEEERLYEVFLNGIFYEGKRPPFVVSACKCPTAPPIYLKDGTNGTDIRIYVDLLGREREFGFTVSY